MNLLSCSRHLDPCSPSPPPPALVVWVSFQLECERAESSLLQCEVVGGSEHSSVSAAASCGALSPLVLSSAAMRAARSAAPLR